MNLIMEENKLYLEVAFNTPLKNTFTYLLPENLSEEKGEIPDCGVRVAATLGRRKMTGFVVGKTFEKPSGDYEIKRIEKIIDSEPLFDSGYLETAKWIAGMYMCSVGEALFKMVPVGRQERSSDLFTEIDNDFTEVIINSDQKAAIEKIDSSVRNLFYLFGVTGSGKTEVYLSLAEKTLSKGRGVIYLVPEISLTHQMIDYVCRRFGDRVAVLHSGITPSQKLYHWRRIQKGEADIVVGARSAVFAPVKDPGLIILDEEHESSYKAGQTPRYHARQIAMHRINKGGGKLIMGSATPSVEAYHLMKTGVIEKVVLEKVAAGGAFPEVDIIDVTGSDSAISEELALAIRDTCAEGRQVILFLNRRGFFYYFNCHQCGYEMTCRQCSVPLTYHKDRNRMICHYCGYSRPPVTVCPECSSLDIGYSGFGTEKIENDVKRLFPYLKIARLDRDSVQKKDYLKKVLDSFRSGETDILLGTQIVAKGLNFPKVKLIGIILADTTLQLPDFRSAERTFALITQVSGRAGRFSPDGKVLIQTFRPSNFAIKAAALRKTEEFYEREIENRKAMGFPPFTRVIRVVFRSKERDLCEKSLKTLTDILSSLSSGINGIRILGPAECPVSVVSGNYRFHVIMTAVEFIKAHNILFTAISDFRVPNKVYMEIDIDPSALM